MPIVHSPHQNHLLADLSAEEFERLTPHLELVQLRLGDILYEPDKHISHAYFPISTIVSLHYVMASGASAEFAGVGNEGVVGISLFMGGETTTSSAMVQTAGYAYRLTGRILKEEFNRSGPMLRQLLRYTQSLVTCMSLTSACNRHHSIVQQLSQFLLHTLDRLPSNGLIMTQELIANLIGVRREGITEAARKLQSEGFIRYRRGHIEVLDRHGLEVSACECYAVVKKEEARLMQHGRNTQKVSTQRVQ